MRRIALTALVVLFVAGCGDSRPGGKVVSPTPSTVVGKIPKPVVAAAGNAAAGKTVFDANGCGACHVFTPAAAKGTVGPDLDKLASFATAANQGTLEEFTHQSIVDPGAYVEKGFANGIMPASYGSQLSAQQLADLVAFLTKPA